MKSSVFLAAGLLTAAPGFAADYLVGSVGAFEVLQDARAQVGAEYRFEPLQYSVVPLVGATASVDGDVYGYAGFRWEVPLVKNQVYLAPNFAVGAYGEGDRDLGGVLQFRSGIDLDFQFQSFHRLGLAFNHISNANIYEHNPGAESLMLTYAIPMSGLR